VLRRKIVDGSSDEAIMTLDNLLTRRNFLKAAASTLAGCAGLENIESGITAVVTAPTVTEFGEYKDGTFERTKHYRSDKTLESASVVWKREGDRIVQIEQQYDTQGRLESYRTALGEMVDEKRYHRNEFGDITQETIVRQREGQENRVTATLYETLPNEKEMTNKIGGINIPRGATELKTLRGTLDSSGTIKVGSIITFKGSHRDLIRDGKIKVDGRYNNDPTLTYGKDTILDARTNF
jgi:hypothetical protein